MSNETELTPLPSLAGIEARVAGATAGPWGWVTDASGEYRRVRAEPSPDVMWAAALGSPALNDAVLIAAAPTDLAALTGAVRAVLALADEWAAETHIERWDDVAALRAALSTHLDLGADL